MTRKQEFSKARLNGRRSAGRTTIRTSGVKRSSTRAGGSTPPALGKKRRSKPAALATEAQNGKRARLSVADPEFYRPLKKPITLRLDADVLAWFKREGRRYQTRINQALRTIMERELRNSGR